MIELHPAPVRSQRDVRTKVDEKLGSGFGRSVEVAASRLTPVERVEWLLGEVLVSLLDRGFHRWIQSFAEGLAIDGPAAVARIAEAGAAVDPAGARLLRWVADRGAAVRAGIRGEGLVSVVPEVALGGWDGVPALARALVERWPDDTDPLGPGVVPHSVETTRVLGRPTGGPVAYPDVSLTVPVAFGLEQAVELFFHTLWAAGAPDDVLDDALHGLVLTREGFPGFVAQWVAVDDAGADRLRDQLFPVSPLARVFGRLELPFPGIGWVDPATWAAVGSGPRTVGITPSVDRSLVDQVRAALRQDPDVLAVEATDFDDALVELLANGCLTGHFVLVVGPGPADAERVAAAVRAVGAEVGPVLLPARGTG